LFFSTELLGLKAESERRLDVFINGCVRKMAWASLTSMQRTHVTQMDLNQRFGIEPASVHVARRLMKWVGKLARMSDDRVPKQMLFAYPCPQGCHGGSGKRVGPWDGSKFPRIGIMPSFSRHARDRIVAIGNHLYRRSTLGSTPFQCAKGLVAINAYGWRTRTVESRRDWMNHCKIKTNDNDNWGCYANWMSVAKGVPVWSDAMECVLQYELGNSLEIQSSRIAKRRRREKRVSAAANEGGVAKVEAAGRKPKKTNRKAPKPIRAPTTTSRRLRGLEPVPVNSTRISRRTREMPPENGGL